MSRGPLFMRNQTKVSGFELLAALVMVLVCVIFWRGVGESFDLVKASVLWTLGAAFTFCLLVETRRRDLSSKLFGTAVGASLIGILGLSTITSISPWTSFWGQSQRYTGFLTCSLLVVLAFGLSIQRSDSSALWRTSFISVQAMYVAFGLLQTFELDPFKWNRAGFGGEAFGLAGNPNTSSAVLAACLPFSLAVSLTHGVSKMTKSLSHLLVVLTLMLIGVFNSFQANIAVALTAVLALFGFHRMRQRRLMVQGGVYVLATLVLPNGNWSPTHRLLVSFFFFVAQLLLDFLRPAWSFRFPRWAKTAAISAVTAGSVLGLLLQRRLVLNGISSGLTERGDFWRAGRDALFDRPLLGSGLQTFGLIFTRFRPETHAQKLENSRTSSVHNVFFGFFVDGGLILGVAFLAVLVLIALGLVRGARRQSDKPHTFAVVASWFSLLVMFLVTVEHIVLLTIFAVLSGLVLRLCYGSTELTHTRRQGTQTNSKYGRVSVCLLAALLLSPITTLRPLRSAMATRDSVTAISPGQSLEYAKRAAEIAFWDPSAWVLVADAQLKVGRFDEAALSINRALKASHYAAPLAYSAAVVQVEIGMLDVALETIDRGFSQDPHAPELRANFLSLLIAIEASADQLGDSGLSGRAREIRKKIEDVSIQTYGEELSS